MKKTLLTTLLLLVVLLSACTTETQNTSGESAAGTDPANQGSTEAAQAANNQPAETASAGLTSDYENAASMELQLVLGMMKLEGTANAVTKEQAAALLPLWTSFSTLSQSMMSDMSNMGQGQAGGTPQQPPTINEEARAQLLN